MAPFLLLSWLLATGLDPAQTQVRPGPIARGDDAEARGLVDRPAPALPELHWLDGRRRSLASLRGHVVVIRSFTHTCPFCASTMPALDAIARDFRDRDVVVLGVYHPKPPRPVPDEEAADHVRAFRISFPVAVDPDWSLVKRWWLDGGRHWTSVTWILDRDGVIRFVHPGGEYHRGGGPDHAACNADERAIRKTLDALLAERPAAAKH